MKTLVLLVMLCVIFPLDAKQMFTQEGVDIYLTHSNNQFGSDFRSPSVSADITGHTLTIEFNENVGKARIIISNMLGVNVESETISSTPNYVVFTISDADFYRIEIVTSSGDQYYGNFIIEN